MYAVFGKASATTKTVGDPRLGTNSKKTVGILHHAGMSIYLVKSVDPSNNSSCSLAYPGNLPKLPTLRSEWHSLSS